MANIETFFNDLEHRLDGVEQQLEGVAHRLEAWAEDLENRHPYATTVIGLPIGLLLLIPFVRRFAERRGRAPEPPPRPETPSDTGILTPTSSVDSLEKGETEQGEVIIEE